MTSSVQNKDIAKYEIVINEGREHRAVISPKDVNSINNIFYNVYTDAKYELWSIIRSSTKITKYSRMGKSTKQDIERLHEYPSNVIAFCADRGRGKTTAMLSFANALEKLGKPKEGISYESFWQGVPEISDVLGVRFEVMSPIDPASMENSESVLQLVLSQMFENFCKKVKQTRIGCEYDLQDDIIADIFNKFQQSARSIDSLYCDSASTNRVVEDELDQIAEMGQSSKLLLQLNDLVCTYLNFIQGDDLLTYLVLQIDDADMDIKRAFQILEDVRKYLSLPRVIILIATNFVQLETTVEQHFLNEYQEGLKYPESMITVEQCHNIAELYLQKAIPQTRRLYLPDIEEVIRQNNASINIVYLNSSNSNILSDGFDYQNQLLNLISKKTGMVFSTESDYLHNLLPSHMRELAQFLPFFSTLPDLPLNNKYSNAYDFATDVFMHQGSIFSDGFDTDEFLKIWEQNINRLEFYLVHQWSSINLREYSCSLFKEFVDKPETVRNLFLLRSLSEYYVRERSSIVSNVSNSALHDELLFEFMNACNVRGIDISSYAENSSYGSYSDSYADVMGALGALTSLPGGDRQYKFAYAIRLFYSIRLHHALIQELRIIVNHDNNIDYPTLTQLLGEGLLRRGPINESETTVFGCWLFEIPSNCLSILPNEFDTGFVKLRHFIRWKFMIDNSIKTLPTTGLVQQSNSWRRINVPLGQVNKDTVYFSPLYPLIGALDLFAQFVEVSQLAEVGDVINRSQIYFALVICLNWDVQRLLFMRIKNQPRQVTLRMLNELLIKIIPDTVRQLSLNSPNWLKEDCYSAVLDNKTDKEDLFNIIDYIQPEFDFSMYSTQLNKLVNCFESLYKILSRSRNSYQSMKIPVLMDGINNNLIAIPKENYSKLQYIMDNFYSSLYPYFINERVLLSDAFSSMSVKRRNDVQLLIAASKVNRSSEVESSSEIDLLDNSSFGDIRRMLISYNKCIREYLNSAKLKHGQIHDSTTSDVHVAALGDSSATHAQFDDFSNLSKTIEGFVKFGNELLKIMAVMPSNQDPISDE